MKWMMTLPRTHFILYYQLECTDFVSLLWLFLISLSLIILFTTFLALVRTVGSGELLECAQNVLSMGAINQLRAGENQFEEPQMLLLLRVLTMQEYNRVICDTVEESKWLVTSRIVINSSNVIVCPEPEILLGSQNHDDAIFNYKNLGLRGNWEMSWLPLFFLMLREGKGKGWSGEEGEWEIKWVGERKRRRDREILWRIKQGEQGERKQGGGNNRER